MPDPARKSLTVLNEVFDKVKARYDSEKSGGKSFIGWLSEYLLMNLERDEFVRQYAPYISKIGIQENTLFLKDTKKDKIIEVRLVNNKLQCTDDDPIYLQYAIAMPELARLKKNH